MVDKTLDVKDLSVAELYETLHEYEFLIKVRQALVIGNHTLTTINIRTNKLQQNQRINQSIYSRVSLGGNQLPEIEEASEGSFYRHHAAEQAINGLLRKEHVQPEILMNGKVYYFGNYYIGETFDVNEIEDCLSHVQKQYKLKKDDGKSVEYQKRPVDWQRESIIFPFMPKKHIQFFTKKSTIFMSKQVPLLLVGEVRDPDQPYDELEKGLPKPNLEKIKIMFKSGDDLRQDNLVLQFFRIMDEMWMEKSKNMEMVRYKVLETGDKVGYIEFVDNSDVITSMHKWRGYYSGPFDEKCIYEYFKQKVYPENFKVELNKLK